MTIAEVVKKYDLSADTLRYYEHIGMIPVVQRTTGGLRDYSEADCKWIELAKCMRSAGLPVKGMSEYVRLTQQGDETIPARRQLLIGQREQLEAQKQAIEIILVRLEYKISRYEEAMKTGVLTWE